jgi:anti-sigma B factor antagonist
MSLELSIRQVSEVTIFDVAGRMVVAAETLTLRAALIHAFEQGHRWILVNCEGLEYLDSSGLGDLIAAHTAIVRRGGVMRIMQPTPRLRELLARTRLDTLLDVYHDEGAAVASFNVTNNLRTQQKLAHYLRQEN